MKKALIIGIEHYRDSPLYGCIADAERVAEALVFNCDEEKKKNFECRLLISNEHKENITRSVLRKELQKFLKKKAKTGLLYFAGHATTNDLEGYFRTQEAENHDPGIPFSEVIKMINASPIPDLIVVIDACHSGGLGRNLLDGTTQIREGISVLSSSEFNERSAEVGSGGLFTKYFCEALEGGAADIQGNVDIGGIFSYVNTLLGAFDQQPNFKSHASRMAILKTFKPKISSIALRKLTKIFNDRDKDLQLNPSFEPSSKNPDSKNVETFGVLQEMTSANLVEPVGEKHMYYAAMNEKKCRLTRQGKFYWTLADQNRI